MKTIDHNDPCIKEIDKDVGNKFKWQWLDHEIDLTKSQPKKSTAAATATSASSPAGSAVIRVRIGETVKKAEEPGKAFCTLCHSLINYGSRGRVALVDHITNKKHKDQVFSQHEIKKTNYTLGSFVTSTSRGSSASTSEFIGGAEAPVPGSYSQPYIHNKTTTATPAVW